MIQVKRVYLPATEEDNFRILVDRLWPRGLTKQRARVDLWMKEIAPSHALRQWYGHDPQRRMEFVKRYRKELQTKRALLAELKRLEREQRTITLLFGAKDERNNQAVFLAKLLRGKR